jgi:hypothetical protein
VSRDAVMLVCASNRLAWTAYRMGLKRARIVAAHARHVWRRRVLKTAVAIPVAAAATACAFRRPARIV